MRSTQQRHFLDQVFSMDWRQVLPDTVRQHHRDDCSNKYPSQNKRSGFPDYYDSRKIRIVLKTAGRRPSLFATTGSFFIKPPIVTSFNTRGGREQRNSLSRAIAWFVLKQSSLSRCANGSLHQLATRCLEATQCFPGANVRGALGKFVL
jgi:hypothetical protein